MTKLRRYGLLVPLAALSLAGCGINSVPTAEEAVNAEFGNLQAEYQRRADLIENLVEVVKAGAASEEEILTQVTEARARATSTQLSPEQLDDPAAVQAFTQAQAELTQARSLLGTVIVEKYPEIRSQDLYTQLLDQIEGTENSILVGRRDYNAAVQRYNTTIRTFPDAIGAKIIHGAEPKIPFEAAAGAEDAPSVDFDS
ncbi:LemA family protein [Sphingomicrobium sediminis]|uniref:LemA family protein n=1 Tax=Sphingomicrobium sediminis TaxID=2950949 RepID=A0A9X2EFZ9_9SPHN|nr:LemA family protein [Sphingomicrobium sediminis]MCM8557310.1 LemA family protein [Sphingomicrobium sediminis]